MRTLRDCLGEALHRMANFDAPRRWDCLNEEVREIWRLQADRFLNVIGPACGVQVVQR